VNLSAWTPPLILLAAAMWVARAGAEDAPAEAAEATHTEVATIGQTEGTRFGSLATLCLSAEGNLLAADGKSKQIVVFDAEGKKLKTWPLEFAPSAMTACADGTLYVGGAGVLAKLDKDGKVLKTVQADAGTFPKSKASGMATTKDFLLVSFGRGWSLSSRSVVMRLDRELGGAKQIVEGLRGCCQRMDIVASDDESFYVAENARFRVVKYDTEGKELAAWGSKDRKNIAGFGACCNPMNLCFGSDGALYTAESGLGRIKRYTVEGKLLGLVGYVDTTRFERAGGLAASCSNMAVAVTADGNRVFVQDVKYSLIHVLEKKKSQ